MSDPNTAADPPLRSELFSADQMELHARRLATAHKLDAGFGTDQLLARLTNNEAVLVDVCTQLAEQADRLPIPAAEWLLDNFYLVEDQIRTARRHFPKGYSRALPRLASGPSAGLPRVYDIALETISHGDGRVDLDVLNRFVMSYQTVTELSLGELWAIPIMLRLALIENLRRVAVRIALSRKHREAAGNWADQILEMAEKDPKSLILVISDMARSHPPMVSAFVAELARRLQGHIPASTLPLAWIEQLLAESHLTIEQLVRLEAQQQAADQVSIGNSIGSLRFLSATDWREFVEAASTVEHILSDDPAGTYQAMTFSTRDAYRHAVEKTARGSAFSESDIARSALELARAAAQRGDERAAHVGFFLIDAGAAELERAVTKQPSHTTRIARFSKQQALVIFLGAIAFATALLTAPLTAQAYLDGWRGWPLAAIALLLALCASRLSVVLVNWLVTLLTPSRALPRLDFSAGVPATARTLVVVPTLLSNAAVVAELCEALEVRFLANRDDRIHFALLTGFLQADTETCAGDDDLLQALVDAITLLNAKYNRTDLFFLLHRPRTWNPQERIWMGYERKRGKLADLNAFLRSGSPHRFSRVIGNVAVLTEINYVITLDVDTQLPRDTARELIGALAHPLNRARFADGGTGAPAERIIAGYAILQPGIAMNITGANASRYARLCGGEAGIDPYTRVVADVYQNVFSEGSFVGKGIYDVDAFERALAGRIPENRILSHDLLEGCIARAGLLSDSQLFEDYPALYGADVRRRQRWTRGDWQLLGWLLPRVPRGPSSNPGEPASTSTRPDKPQSYQRNPLSALSRWKILDNLLRSLNSSALTLLFVFGWLLSPSPLFWTLVALGALLIPPLSVSALNALRKSPDMLVRQHVLAITKAAGNHFAQALLTLVCLPFDAYVSLDAIVRTLVRLTLTHRRLLEWRASSEVERHHSNDFMQAWYSMWVGPAAAITIAIAILVLDPTALPIAAPILLLWLLAPAITWWLSQPLRAPAIQLSTEQLFFLRKNARRTWGFFEEFVVAGDNWLPPDNYQEYRGAVIAHRTSPTNMGLALLANLSAHDFGYIPTAVLLKRTADTLHTMDRLERYQGHFYNWYDTQSLLPLNPIYISTVDSGNLAGHLLVLRQGLLALVDQPLFAPNWLSGIRDTLGIVVELNGDIHEALGRLQTVLESIDAPRSETPSTLLRDLDQLLAHAETFAASGLLIPGSDDEWWSQALVTQCRALGDEVRSMLPWLTLAAPLQGCETLMLRVDTAFFTANPSGSAIPTLRELATVEERLSALFKKEISAAETPMASAWLHALRPV
ncbi:MAG: cyclic beta 1-2 glucan synthetase, partial [Spongiibacteraceae bacterium]